MAVQDQPISKLGDLLRLFTRMMTEIGDGTTIQIGRQYLEQFGTGTPPKLLFVPAPDGQLGGVPRLNARYVAGFTDVCLVYIRGAEAGDDFSRLDNVDDMVDRVVNILKALGAAIVEVGRGKPRDDSPLQVDAYGAQKVFMFAYTRGIPRNHEIWNRAFQVIQPTAPTDPDRPQGDNGFTFVPEVFTVDPVEPRGES
jgi:hypothetical protein